MKRRVRTIIGALALGLLYTAPLAGAQTVIYEEGFEDAGSNWPGGPPVRVGSGTAGVTSASGGFHAEAPAGAFTRWGGYHSVFRTGGFTTSLDIYLDVDGGAANDTRFDFSSAASGSDGNHQRDFIFSGGFYNDATGPGTGNRFIFSASNGSPGWPKNPARSPVAITSSGWYTFEHVFQDNGGVLEVVMTIKQGATVFGTWTLSDPSDTIPAEVGGNRYGWFPVMGFASLPIDNATLTVTTLPPVQNTDSGLYYDTIQDAIDAADPDDTIAISAGTYVEQLEVDFPLTLQGAGEGVTTVKGFANMPLFWTSSADNKPIIYVHDTDDVVIRDLTVDGDGQGNTNHRYQGIAGVNAGLHVEDVTVIGVRHTPFNGAQGGIGIYVYNTDGTDRDIVVRDCTVSDFQKNALALNGPNAMVLVEDCDITGAGPSGVIAQNGIQIWDPVATVRNNSVSEIEWTGETWVAAGILLFDSSNTLLENNTVTNCQASIYATNYVSSPVDLELTGNEVTGGNASWIVGYDGVELNNNTFSGCDLGLNLYNSDNATGSGNEYDGNDTGFWIDGDSTSVVLTDETYNNNTTAGVKVADTASGVSITESCFTGNTVGLENTAVASVAASPNYWGATSGPSGDALGSGDAVSGLVEYAPWYTDAAKSVLSSSVTADETVDPGETYEEEALTIGDGVSPVVFTVDGGILIVESLLLLPGATLEVIDGDLEIGDGTVIAGTFSIFNSFGSWNINGDTTFTVGQSLALITDVHVAGGKTLTVNGGGTLVFDGCVIDSQTPGTPYNINVEDDGLLTIARCVVSDAVIDIDTDSAMVPAYHQSRIYDSSFTDSEIEATADSAFYHNIWDAATDSASNTDLTSAFDSVDGWSSVTSAASRKNDFALNFVASTEPNRTFESGNLFVQPLDDVVMNLDVGLLDGHTITAAESLIGYNSALLQVSDASDAVSPGAGWEVIVNSGSDATALGLADSALGLDHTMPGDDGIGGPATIGTVTFEAQTEGYTQGFFRVQTDGNYDGSGVLIKDTRLTKSSGGVPSFLAPFTLNTGMLVIDGTAPTVDVSSANGAQVQASQPSPVDVLDPATGPASPNHVFRNGNVVGLTFTATDGTDDDDSGLDLTDLGNDFALQAVNGTDASVLSGYTIISATDTAGVVTYVVELTIPATATNGVYDVKVTVTDRSGNDSAETTIGSFMIDQEVLANVELEAFAGGDRDVVFVATNASNVPVATWTKTVSFTGTLGSVNLEAVPSDTANISAKTAWNLRSKVAATFTAAGVGTADLTGADELPGGDITGDNVVNTLDYSVLRYHWTSTTNATADIDGSLAVDLTDYNVLRANFYTAGDPE